MSLIRRTSPVLFLVAAAIAAAAVLWPARLTSAHGNVLRASPAPSASLNTAPDRIIIWFTEPVEPQFSDIRVLGADGERVDNADSQGDPTEQAALSVTLQPLPDGVYTVVWRNVSRMDGHAVRGSYIFSVGQGFQPPASSLEDLSPPLLQSGADPWQRWIFFLGVVTFAGGLLFELAVISPTLGAAETDAPQGQGTRVRVAQKLSDRLSPLLAIGFVLIVMGSLGQILQQARVTSGDTFLGSAGSALVKVVSGTDWGRYWLIRSVFFALAGGAALMAVRARRPREEGDTPGLTGDSFFAPLALLLAMGGLALTTFMSHSAAAPSDVRGPAMASDLIHLTAAAAWVGGLIYMVAVALPVLLREPTGEDRRAAFAAIVPRFSTIAFLSLGALVVTGLFSGWMQVTVPGAVRTPYGWTLVAKVALLVPLFALALANAYIVSPKLGRDDNASRRLKRFVTIEVALAVTVLLATGWLASLEPARQTASRTGIGKQAEATFATQEEGADIKIRVSPVELGYNLVAICLTSRRGDPVTDATDVRARLIYRGADLGSEFVSGIDHGGGVWIVHGLPLNVAGDWTVEAVIVRPDAFDARVAFPFTLRSSTTMTDRIRPTRDATHALLGLEIALLGLVAVAAAAPLRKSARRAALMLAAPGAAGVVAGVALAVLVLTTRTDQTSGDVNPVLFTAQSVSAGRVNYLAKCATCHGESGRGGGPGAEGLPKTPADLIVHAPLHADRKLFEFIRDGIPASGMPSGGGSLSERQMWDLVNYLRTLNEEK